MISMNVTVDQSTLEFINRFDGSFGSWDEHLHNNMAAKYAQSMTEFIKPNVRAVAALSNGGTGESERSIRADVGHSGDGFDIDFFGSLGAFYMDEGNFDANAVIQRVGGNHTWPVGLRTGGPVTFAKLIHGMGYATPSTPKHYSELAASAWDTDDFTSIAMLSMENWLNEVVG